MTEGMSVTPSARGWDVTLNVDGQDVSGLAVVDKKTRVGKAHLKMAGVAGVWTDEAHRKKGYASRVMWASVDEMVRRRYDVSILFGIEDFYHRYGYAACAANSVCQVETEALPRSSSGFRVRAARSGDLPRIVSVYAKTNVDRSVSAVRSRFWQPVHGNRPGWRMPRMGAGVVRRPGKAIVGEDEKGRVIGYVSYDAQDGHCMVTEVGATDRSVYPALAHRVRRLASGVGADRVRFCLPVDDPFGQYLGRFGCGWSVHFPENSGSMGKLVSISSTFQQLIHTLAERLGESSSVMPQSGLTFVIDEEAVTLLRKKSGLVLTDVLSKSVVRIDQMPMIQLLCGYRSVEDLMITDEIQVAKAVVPVVNALFPRSNPYVWWGDRF